jgi:hypothetical protein
MKKKLYSASFQILILCIAALPARSQEMPAPGDIIITEFMANPSAVADTRGEWFELLNISDKVLKLNGLLIKDESTNRHEIGSEEDLLLNAGEFFLLGRSGNYDENGGINPGYAYSNFSLGNTEDEIILSLPDGTVLDQLAYNSDWEIISGSSLELDPAFMDSGFNQDPLRWNPGVNAFGMGDLGSPGYENSATSGHPEIARFEKLQVYPNPCFDEFYVDLKLNSKSPLDISLVNLVGQEMVIYGSSHCDELNLQFDTHGLEKGIWILRIRAGNSSLVRKLLVY